LRQLILPFAQAAANRYTSSSMAIARDNTPERLVSAARADEEQGFETQTAPPLAG